LIFLVRASLDAGAAVWIGVDAKDFRVGRLEVDVKLFDMGLVVELPKVDVIGDGPGDSKEPDMLPKLEVAEKLGKVFPEGAEDVPNGLING